MQKTIYFHTGMPKTASSSIQNALYHAHEYLKSKGLFYPVTDVARSHENAYVINMMSFPLQDYENYENNDYTKELFRTHFKHQYLLPFLKTPYEKLLLSREGLSMSPHSILLLEAVQELGYSVKVIVYVRPPAGWVASLWGQRIKNGKIRMSLQEYLYKTYDFLFFNYLFSIIHTLGKENVIIRPYEKIQWKNHDIIDDFFDIFNIDAPSQTSKNMNVSLGRNSHELHRLFLHIYGGGFRPLHRDFVRQLLALQTKERSIVDTLSDSEILDITERTRHLYTKIANIYGKESLFINEFPRCYGQERAPYTTPQYTHAQEKLLREFLLQHPVKLKYED